MGYRFFSRRRPPLDAARYSESLERVAQRTDVPVAVDWDDDRFRAQRDRDLAVQRIGWRSTVLAVFVALLVAGTFSTAKLVEIAERMPLGSDRDRAIEVAAFFDERAHSAFVDRPAAWVADLRNVGDDAGEQVNVIDEGLLATPTPGSTTIPGSTPAPGSNPAPTAGRPAATVASTTTVVPAQPQLRGVSGGDPLRIFVGGDSQAEYLGYGIDEVADQVGLPVELELKFQISTGLARPDVFNWPAELAAQIEARNPEAVVLFLGANDHQDMQTESGVVGRGSDGWSTEYRRRVAITMDLLESEDRRVYWVAQPPMRDGRLNTGVALVNAITQAEAADRPWVVWVDAYTQFGGDGGFSTFLAGPDGAEVKVRTGDGVHLTRTGADWLAADVVTFLESTWSSVE